MTSRKRYAILTPFDKAEIVAGIAKIHGIEADIVRTESGVVIVRDVPVPVFDDWDIAELLGDMPQESSASSVVSSEIAAAASSTLGSAAPSVAEESEQTEESGQAETEGKIDSDDALAVAAVISKLSPYGVVLFQADLGDDVGGEDGVSGLVKAQRVLAGQAGEELPAGLLLNTLSAQIEQIVVGLVPLEEISNRVIRSKDAEQLLNTMFPNQPQRPERTDSPSEQEDSQ